jgi:predicted NUDIX family NTP pyrophosphohydrolase
MKTTCGIFLFDKYGRVLLGHPTNHAMDLWSIPKGLMDKGEDRFTAAVRELYEETNISLSNVGKFTTEFLGEAKYKHKKKKLAAFYIDTNNDFSEYDIKCDSMVTSMPGDDFPEIDLFKWATIEEALPIIHETQKPFLELLAELRNHDS